jgi:hypothetical protein
MPPLSQDDPALDYDGSWGDASKDWPAISFRNEKEAETAYVHAWKDAKVPYGSYVLVGKELRLETLELLHRVEKFLVDRGWDGDFRILRGWSGLT